MFSQYEKDLCGIQLPFSRFDDNMKHLCGRTATICKIDEKNNEKVYLRDWDNNDGDKDWTFSIYMLEKVREYKTFNFIDDTMDTSNRPVVDLLDHAVDSLYPNIIMDVKTCGKNLFDNCKIQTDFCEKYIKGIWENKEEKDMNKVVNLWYERNRDKIVDKYKEKEIEFYNNKYSIVESFNELVDTFNNNLEDLYKLDKATEQFVLKENAPTNVVKYCIDLDKLKEEFEVEYLIKRNEELKEIEDIRLEVEAQLSLSDDLEYQTKILRRYGIIDKKTNKIVGQYENNTN